MRNKILYGLGKTLFIIKFLNSQLSNVQADIFSLEDFDPAEHRKTYNALPSVEDADAVRKQSTLFTSFLQDAGAVVTKYELQPYVGVRLIHKHFLLDDNQLMAEEYKLVEQIPSLVTSACNLEKAKEIKALPASWIYANNPQEKMHFFETSADPAIKVASAKLQESPEFLDEMGKLLREYQLNNLLSIAILNRSSLVATESESYLETSSMEPNESVVQLWSPNNLDENIHTSWSFKGPREHWCKQVVVSCKWAGQGKHLVEGYHQKVK